MSSMNYNDYVVEKDLSNEEPAYHYDNYIEDEQLKQQQKQYEQQQAAMINSRELWEYVSSLERINLDEERIKDLANNKGFIISSPKNIKKDMKNPDGIFSSKYGQKLGDMNPYADRYKCECGNLHFRFNRGMTCPVCGHKVKYVDDDYSYFGWIILKDKYWIIHPNLYKSIEFFFGNGDKSDKEKHSKLYNIINYSGKLGQDGKEIPSDQFQYPPDQPYYGLGMIDFVERFDEIMQYYLNKNPKKKEYYDDIMANRDKIFTHSIPVFTTHLRPVDIRDNNNMFYEPSNGTYNMINRLVYLINKDNTGFSRKKKPKNQLLFDLQQKYMELYNEIDAILSGKKGKMRSLLSGRFNFSARAVIIQNPDLRIDQITLPYTELVITQQQKIINILHRTYNMSYQDAYAIWERAKVSKDERVAAIIDSLIKANPEGLPVLINRNPTLAFGSILQVFCVAQTDTLTLGIPLQVLKLLAADFDGDAMNIFHIINKAFYERCNEVFNPRNAMYISRDNGKFNTDVCPQRDTLINLNTFLYLGRDKYNKNQMNKINTIRERQRQIYGF